MGLLKDKVALVTGRTSGIGRGKRHALRAMTRVHRENADGRESILHHRNPAPTIGGARGDGTGCALFVPDPASYAQRSDSLVVDGGQSANLTL